MIDLYAMGSPNVVKVIIALEEMHLAYELRPVNITKSDNFTDAFIALSPTAKVPAIVDHNAEGGVPHAVFESGAILLYLADKTESFLPSGAIARSTVIQWLMMQMANVGPYFGQLVHFTRYASSEENQYAFSRYKTIVRNTLDVIERRLAASTYIGGEDYSIADMALLPWVHPVEFYLGEGSSARFPSIQNWADRLGARPAVIRAREVAADLRVKLAAAGTGAPEQLDRLLARGRYSRA